MKKTKLINILFIFIFALFLFRGDEVGAEARTKAYDAQIKSDIAQIHMAIEMCYDENDGNYLGCDNDEKLFRSGSYIPKPPKCSYDEKYNIIVSEDGKSFVIWADLVNTDGYWCLDSDTDGFGRVVLNDEVPITEKAFCSKDGHYTKQKIKSNCMTRNNNIGIYFVAFIFLLTFIIILFIILELINKYYFSHKFKHRSMFWIALLSVTLVPVVGIAYLLIAIVIITLFTGIDSGIAILIGLPIIVLLVYFCIKSLLNSYKNLISSSAIRNLSLLILFFDLLIFIISTTTL
jgi:hypothetical protein